MICFTHQKEACVSPDCRALAHEMPMAKIRRLEAENATFLTIARAVMEANRCGGPTRDEWSQLVAHSRAVIAKVRGWEKP